jgi:hypothetical protein
VSFTLFVLYPVVPLLLLGDHCSLLRCTTTVDGQLKQLRLYYTQRKPSGQLVAPPVLNEQAGFAWEALSPALCMLRFSGCDVAASLVQSLAQLQGLTSLSFVHCSFGSSISELGSALGKLTRIQELEVEGSATQLGSDAVKGFLT